LCVLGAGNAHDLDLGALSAVFARMHLVDIDDEAVRAGAAQQGVGSGGVSVLGGVDLADVEPAAVEELVGERSGVVASTGLLSQLIDDEHDAGPLALERIEAVRARHLNLMIGLLRPGGWGVLVNDLVSSATAPMLGSRLENDLAELMVRLIQDGNFFTGTNPYAICGQLVGDPELAAAVSDVTLHPPWIWTLGADNHRLSYAVTFRRRTEPASGGSMSAWPPRPSTSP